MILLDATDRDDKGSEVSFQGSLFERAYPHLKVKLDRVGRARQVLRFAAIPDGLSFIIQ
jgi:hypothetical protein